MKISRLDDLQLWKDAATACESATFFHTPEWYQAFAGTDGDKTLHSLRIDFPDGKTAVFPILEIHKPAGHSRHLSGPGGVYGGWLCTPSLNERQAQMTSNGVRRHIKDLFWRINPFYDTQANVVNASWHCDSTQYLDLQPGFEQVFHDWSKGHRAAVSQAKRNDVIVRQATSYSDWRSYYKCYLDSLTRWGTKASSHYEWRLFEYFSTLAQDAVRLWLAERYGQLLAGALIFYHNRHAVYWHGAAYAEHFHFRSANLLQYEIIRHASSIGIRFYDFNPSGGHEGVVTFKHGFGSQVIQAPYIDQRQKSLWRKVATMTRQLLVGEKIRS